MTITWKKLIDIDPTTDVSRGDRFLVPYENEGAYELMVAHDRTVQDPFRFVILTGYRSGQILWEITNYQNVDLNYFMTAAWFVENWQDWFVTCKNVNEVFYTNDRCSIVYPDEGS